MLPGKTYRPEDILKILRKRFWVVVLPWALIAAGTAAVARKLPDMYRSFATIQVIPPQVPSNIVQANTSVRLQDRLQASTQTILSRTRLERVIQEFNLYEEERKSEIMEDVVADMRNDIKVGGIRGDSFTVSYEGRVPATVMKVTERLASYFKEESAKEGERRAEGTSSFVDSQVEEARRKLLAMEGQLTQYRMAHVGELPEERAANMQAVQNINQQLASLAQQIHVDSAAKASLERQIEQAEASADPGAPPVAADPAGTASQRLAMAKLQLADMLDVRRLKPDHPDVRILQNAIKKLQAAADAEARSVTVGAGAATNPAELQRIARLAGWKQDLEQLKERIQASMAEEQKLKRLAAGYQARIDRAPARGAEMLQVNRDYETLNKIYLDLVAAREKSAMSVSLENRQMGEQFVLLDAARMPERPFSPDRMMINLIGVVGGLALGLAIVVLIEYRDTTFKTDSELASVIGLPVLAVVPAMRAESERRTDFRRALFLNAGLASVVLVCLAVLTYSFVFVR